MGSSAAVTVAYIGCPRKLSPVEPCAPLFDHGAVLGEPASRGDLEEDEKFSSQVIWLKYFLFDVLPY